MARLSVLIALTTLAPLLLSACSSTPQKPAATLEQLDSRFRSAYSRDSRIEAVEMLTEIAARYPKALPHYPDEAIFRIAGSGPQATPAEEEARFELRRQLFAQRWKNEFGVEPSGLWLDLIRQLVERNRLDEAVQVVPHVQSAGVMVTLRVDRRFDVLMQRSAPVLSVESIAKADVASWTEANARFPSRLRVVLDLVNATLTSGRFEHALALADSAVARMDAAKSPGEAYTDAGDWLNWLHNYRAQALAALGRWNDAEAAYQKAKSLAERGVPNVSNTINLAAFYLRTGRADDALSTVAPLVANSGNTSSYGRVQVQRVLHAAAVLKNDEAAARKAFEFMSTHRADAPNGFQNALLWANRPDDWAAYLIERLQNPLTRSEALKELQIYIETPASPSEMVLRKRKREFADRADVRAVIAEVGAIQQFAVLDP